MPCPTTELPARNSSVACGTNEVAQKTQKSFHKRPSNRKRNIACESSFIPPDISMSLFMPSINNDPFGYAGFNASIP
jgi:hypothetical protein